jgi:hypothetical protein
MRPAAAVSALFCAFLLSTGLGAGHPVPALQPTSLEAFAADPVAEVTWSKPVGTIDSREAHVNVTAVVIEDTAKPPHRMRGVRIDLANAKATDQVYLDESRLEAVKNALDQIDSEIASFKTEPEGAAYRYRGAAEFWHPDVRIHTLNAAYYIAPDSSGLSLSAYKGQEFRLPDHRPSELARAIVRAMDELKQQ